MGTGSVAAAAGGIVGHAGSSVSTGGLPGYGGTMNIPGQGGAIGGLAGQPGGTAGNAMTGASGAAPSGGGTPGAGGAAGTAGAAGGNAVGGSTSGTPDKSAGCGMAPPADDKSVMVGSGTGSYILDLPTNYDNTKAYPVIFVWHGAGVTNTAFHDYLNMHKEVGNDGIVVTPECVNSGATWPNDASYFDALYDHFTAKYCIDKNRVFTTGHSMGGLHTGLIGCLRGDKLRADAVLAAPHPTGQCVKGHMAAMMSVGMSDFVASGPTEFQWWAQENGCTYSMTTPVDPTTFTTGAPAEGGTCVEYGGCAPGTPLRTCTFMGAHEIPPWVQGAVWSFFKKL
jgi:pimeloyl-ACP methyl ester carboxylesterase